MPDQNPTKAAQELLAKMSEASSDDIRLVMASLKRIAGPVDAKASLLSSLIPRMLFCLVLAVALAAGVALLSPQQIPVAAYKLALVTMAGYLGYWLDRWCFPYARPDSFLAAADWRTDANAAADQANHPVAAGYEQIFSASMLRRALIMLGTMLAMGLGL